MLPLRFIAQVAIYSELIDREQGRIVISRRSKKIIFQEPSEEHILQNKELRKPVLMRIHFFFFYII